MNRHSRKNIILLLRFQAMAVAIICFGSLINFHQYKIWGKPLIPNFIGYKRDVEKYSRTLSLTRHASGDLQSQLDFSPADIEFDIDLRHGLSDFAVTFIPAPPDDHLPANYAAFSSGLRGPPVS